MERLWPRAVTLYRKGGLESHQAGKAFFGLEFVIMFDLSSARFAFLDLETTGLSPWFGDRICEVGIVLAEGKRIKQQYQTLVKS